MPSVPIFRRGPQRANRGEPPGHRACPGQAAVPPQDLQAVFRGGLPVVLRAESVQADCRRGNPPAQRPVEPPLQPHLESPPNSGPFGDRLNAERFRAQAQGTTWVIWGGVARSRPFSERFVAHTIASMPHDGAAGDPSRTDHDSSR